MAYKKKLTIHYWFAEKLPKFGSILYQFGYKMKSKKGLVLQFKQPFKV